MNNFSEGSKPDAIVNLFNELRIFARDKKVMIVFCTNLKKQNDEGVFLSVKEKNLFDDMINTEIYLENIKRRIEFGVLKPFELQVWSYYDQIDLNELKLNI